MRPSEIIALLDKYSVTPSKQKGQNFLIDDRVAERQVEYAEIQQSNTILEIGPGLGILTEKLIKKGKVIAIEMDKGLVRFLDDKFDGSIRLIEGDALAVPFPPFDKMVANLPYSISSPIVFKLLEYDFQSAILMLQKEFADRMVAEVDADDYSRLTVNVYYRAECEILEKVPKSRFWPSPKVDSAIVKLKPRPPPFRVEDEKLFFHLVDILFQHRRKKIGTVLKKRRLVDPQQSSRVPFMDLRIEALTPEQIGDLSDAIHALQIQK